MLKATVLSTLLLATLAGCAGGGGSGSVPVATGTTFEQQLVSAAGLGDFSQVPAEKASRDGANISTAALTGLTTASPVGGMTSLSSLGMGALMFLAAPPKSAASYSQMIALAPADWSIERVQVDLQRKLTTGLSDTVEAKGYKPQKPSEYHGQTVWIRDGCEIMASLKSGDEQCAQFYEVLLQPKGIVGGKRTYIVTYGASSAFESLQLVPPRTGNQADVASSRNALSKAPGMLYLYVAPIQTAEGWSEPFVVGPSGAKPLVR